MGLRVITEEDFERAEQLANYIADDKEREDYLNHCEENGLDHTQVVANSRIEGAHIFAVAMAFLGEE